MDEKEGKRVLGGQQGLASYLRYLNSSIPDLSFVQSLQKTEEASVRLHEASFTSQREGEDHEVILSQVREEAKDCMQCPLCSTRTHVVFGEGDPNASLMFVGEGPGADEDATGRPFVGRAGDLLTKMIKAMGFDRSQVYIANIVKCRPPGNRVPEEHERQSCLPFLHRQISIVSPKALVLLGQTAAASLLGRSGGISKLRGKEARIDDHPKVRVMPTYHPAYLLRNPSAKADVWEDLKQVMSWLGRERP